MKSLIEFQKFKYDESISDFSHTKFFHSLKTFVKYVKLIHDDSFFPDIFQISLNGKDYLRQNKFISVYNIIKNFENEFKLKYIHFSCFFPKKNGSKEYQTFSF